MKKAVIYNKTIGGNIQTDDGSVREFGSKGEAKKYLTENGVGLFDSLKYKILESCGTCFRCGGTLYRSMISDYTYQCFRCDEDFYAFEQEGSI